MSCACLAAHLLPSAPHSVYERDTFECAYRCAQAKKKAGHKDGPVGLLSCARPRRELGLFRFLASAYAPLGREPCGLFTRSSWPITTPFSGASPAGRFRRIEHKNSLARMNPLCPGGIPWSNELGETATLGGLPWNVCVKRNLSFSKFRLVPEGGFGVGVARRSRPCHRSSESFRRGGFGSRRLSFVPSRSPRE